MSERPEGVCAVLDATLAHHLPWRVGGRCDALITVHSRDALGPAQAWCRDRGWQRTLIGSGSRTLVRDGGLAGAVMRLGAGFSFVHPTERGVRVGAATPLAVLPTLSGAPAAWQGLRFAPGSVGASIALDPGWEGWVRAVSVVLRGKERWEDFAAVRARGEGVWVVEVELAFAPEGEGRAPGPVGASSWYQPPKNDEVTALIRQAALADTRLRQVAIPESAPELLVNLGGGTARDLSMLHKSAIERVHREIGVQLEDRMNWIGRVS